MMVWLLLALLLSWVSPAWATFAEVGGGTQRATNSIASNVDSTTLAFPSNVTANNLLVVWGSAWANLTPSAITVTGTQGAYTVVSCPGTTDSFRNFIAFRRSTTSSAETVTVDPAGTGAYITFTIDEFTLGNGQAPVLDATGSCTNGTGTAVSGTVTTTVANALILGVLSGTEGQTITPGGSYTQAGEREPTHPHSAVFRVATTAQSYTVDWTLGAATSGAWAMHAIALRESTPDTQAPTQPQGLNCTGQSISTIACTWSASTDNVGVADYVLERSPAGCATFAQIATPTVTSYTDTNLSTNTTYCYRVSARDGASPQNVSVVSATFSAATLTTRQATLTWTNNGTYTNIVVQRCPGSACSNFVDLATIGGTQTLYIDSNSPTPVAGYRVRATLTGAPDSAPSNIVYTTPSTAAVLSVAPPSLTYGATVGGSNPPAQALTISKAPGGPAMVWTLSDDAAWFSCTPASGTDNTILSCSVNISGLSSGTQFATITVTAPGATNSPTTVLVTLNLAPASNPGTPPGQGRSGRVR